MKKILCILVGSALLLFTNGTTSISLANGTVNLASGKACPPKPKHHHHHKANHQAPCPEPCAEPVSCEPVCNPCPPRPCYAFQTGPYAGALIGYNHMWAKTKGKLLDFFKADSKKTSNSFIGEVALGWRYVFPIGLTVGIDIAGDFSDDHVKANLTFLPAPLTAISTLNHKLKRNFSLVPAFTVGTIICNNWHAFVKLGMGISWFKDHLLTADGRSMRKTRTIAGFVPGVGLEYGYNKNLSIIGTVGYEVYEQVQAKYFSPIAGVAQGQVETKIRPKFFNAKIGLLYRM